METVKLNPEHIRALEAAVAAANVILRIRQGGFETEFKADESPVTIADRSADSLIRQLLEGTNLPVLSEESVHPDYRDREGWESYWLVDPLDGTREFVEGRDEYTVNIALVKKGTPVWGVVCIPEQGVLYWGDTDQRRAWKLEFAKGEDLQPGHLTKAGTIQPKRSEELVRVGISRSHNSVETLDHVKETFEGRKVEFHAVGSSLKFCYLAEGRLDYYPRFSTTMEWDTAAGEAICRAVGLKVLQAERDLPLQYNKMDLRNPFFIVRHQYATE